MAVFKCKMCGGDLETKEGDSVGVCQYCGTKQTLPRLDSDKKANLYDRANHFRRRGDYDKAMALYETILQEDGSDAEAYWSLVLCRYGVAYVEDPATHQRIPTCNRTQYTSILADGDYQAALAHADGYQKEIYREEAKAIDEIQKGILAISDKEDPFDVFICYKESDDLGRRTPDSVLAAELYQELTEAGLKVFFARITLEDKLGSAYEPYIFAALGSAKVMVVIGTKPEYFQAVWVKNEWSRFLALIRDGTKKTLIPAYRDMDPYDLPEEFSHLQAQDMAKLGFMQDLIRGIEKIVGVEEETAASPNNSQVNPTIESLMKRVHLFLEDGDWAAADEYCERVLDLDVETAEAYIGKLMAARHLHREQELENSPSELSADINFNKAMRFASPQYQEKLDAYVQKVNARLEEEQKEQVFQKALLLKKNAELEPEQALSRKKDLYRYALETLAGIPGYKEADQTAALCQQALDQLDMAQKRLAEQHRQEQEQAARELRLKEEERKLMRERAKAAAEQAAKKKAQKKKQKWIIFSAAAVSCAAILLLLFLWIIPQSRYDKGYQAYQQGQYQTAGEFFIKIPHYKDAADYLNRPEVALLTVGCTVSMGSFDQDNNTANGEEEIQWIVAKVEDDRALLLSKDVLTYAPFYHPGTPMRGWEGSDLRAWLNETFLSQAFTPEEQGQLIKLKIESYGLYDEDWETVKTEDTVFLLSEEEMTDLDSRVVKACSQPVDKAMGWWLRDRYYSNGARLTTVKGLKELDHVDAKLDQGVRPAVWVRVE